MGKLWAVFEREYSERVRTKWFLISTFFGPLLFAALMIVPAWLSIRSRGAVDLTNTVVIDATGTGLGNSISEALASGPRTARRRPEVRIVSPAEVSQAESTATHEVMRERYNGYIVLDEETAKGERARYAGRSAGSLPAMDRLEDVVRNEVLRDRLTRSGIAAEDAKELALFRLRLSTERITDRGRGGSGAVSAIFALAVAFLLYVVIIFYGQAIMRGVMEEKQTRVAEVIVSSIKPDALLAGKVLGVGAVGLTQQIVWVVTGLLLIDLRAPILRALGAPIPTMQMPSISLEAAVLLFLFFLLGFAFYMALFAAVGAMVNTEQEAQQASMPVMMLVIAAALFIQPVTFSPTGALAQWASIIPFTSPILMPVRLSLINVPWIEIIAGIVVLLLSGGAAVWMAARIYRVGLLMYGKRPTLRELGHWIRYA
jgi:ABC-2 type transport system permease protein